MKCPVCKKGEIHVTMVYNWDTAEDGTIIETKRVASLLNQDAEDIAVCFECNQRFDIDYENDKVIPAYQETWLEE